MTAAVPAVFDDEPSEDHDDCACVPYCPLCEMCAVMLKWATVSGRRWRCLDCGATWTIWQDGSIDITGPERRR